MVHAGGVVHTLAARAALRTAMDRWRTTLQDPTIVWLPDNWGPGSWYCTPWKQQIAATATTNDHVFWVHSRVYRNDDDAVFTRRMEAVELLALLAQVDLSLWRAFVHELWSANTTWTAFFAAQPSLCVGVHLSEEANAHGVEKLCDYIVASCDPSATRSTDYQETRALMARVLEMSLPSKSLPVVPVRIGHQLNVFATPGNMHDWLSVTRQHHVVERATLRVAQLDPIGTFNSASQETIDALVAIRALGIQVLRLPVFMVEPSGRALEAFPLAMRSLLEAGPELDAMIAAPTNGPPETTRPARGVESITLYNTAHEVFVPGIFSAVYASRSLRGVSLIMTRATEFRHETEEPDGILSQAASHDRSLEEMMSETHGSESELLGQRMAWWVAYALFRRRDPLVTLDVMASTLTMQDVVWMGEMLKARNPMALLFPTPSSADCFGVAVASQVWLHDPHDARHQSSLRSWVQSTSYAFEVLGESRRGFVPVLLPGWGKAWVHESTATIFPAEGAHRSTSTSPTHLLVYNIRTEAMEAVLALVRLVGHDVKLLTITDSLSLETSLDAFCVQLLAACPHLEQLELCGIRFTSFHFLRHVRAVHCPHITKLSLQDVTVQDGDSVTELLHALAQPHNLTTINFQALQLTVKRPIGAPTLGAALRLLAATTNLREVSFLFPVSRDLFHAYVASFKSIARASVPLRSILAVLSAPTINRFDSAIVRQIVAFAATPYARSIKLRGVGT